MFKSLIAKYIVEDIFADYPHINSRKCINSVLGQEVCLKCINVCRMGAITKLRIDCDKCINCNMCVAECPVQAIKPSKQFLIPVFIAMENDDNSIIITCTKNKHDGAIKVSCIAAIPSELLLALSINHNVYLDESSCENCQYNQNVLKRISEITEFVGKEYLERKYTIISSVTRKTYSRRESFRIVKRQSESILYNYLKEKFNNNDECMLFRKILNQKIKSGNDVSLNLYTPEFNERCWACGICTNMCPNGALELVDNIYMQHKPWLCSKCEICSIVCNENSIESWKVIKVDGDYNCKVITKINATKCKKCNAMMKKMGDCNVCYYCGYKEANCKEG